MELKPFEELIKMSKEKIDEALAPVRAKRMEAKANLKKAEIDEAMLELETTVHEMCMEKDINLDKLIDKLDEMDVYERRRNQLSDIVSQLFPVKVKSK